MKAAALTDIKKELKYLDQKELAEIIARLARFKKDNKELLTYLIFEAQDEDGYIQLIKEYLDDSFEEVHKNSFYYTKKNVAKILRQLNKYIRYSSQKRTEVEILIYFCKSFISHDINIQSSNVVNNIYRRQISKIEKALSKLHEDARIDYANDVDEIKSYL